jgi:hypothetical protein
VRAPPPSARREPIDYRGVLTLSLGLVALLVALDQATDWGWGDPRIIGLLVACAALLALFARTERRAGSAALVPREVMSNRGFRATCLAVLLMSATFFAALMYLPQFFQKILDYSPLEAGAGLLPMMGVFALVSFAAGPLYERLGAKAIVSAGAVCLAAGPFLISRVESDSGYGALVPGMVVLGLGVGLFYSSVTTAGVTALDPSRASLAGAIVYMFQVAGGSIGLGLTTTVFTTASQDKLRDTAGDALSGNQLDAVHGILAGTESARDALERLPAAVAERITELVREAFVAGMQWAFRLVAALALLGVVVSVLAVGGSLLRARRPAPAPD